ncbi:NUDIX domain-containing protein [Kribbella deserti]|uniref:NUDIX domain-containing protein n=1 Tax=Kribbella deserti TaxID=1926257 RepID=A0ABV6QUP4_9ACTN
MTDRTWDGLEIASDNPRGTTVVVRRPGGDGYEYLLLHRAQRGADYEGDWAWTAPAGCRQPGEAVLAAAERELAEEAGLSGFPLWPVDLSGGWVVFGCDVPADVTIDLVDPEHDRYEWVSFDEAAARVIPVEIALGNFCDATRVAASEVAFKPVEYAELPSAASPAEQEFLATIDGTTPYGLYVVQVDGQPAGYIAHYPDDPETVGLAVALDNEKAIPATVWSYLRDIVKPAHPDVRRVLADPAPALAKAGFPDGTFDVPHLLG